MSTSGSIFGTTSIFKKFSRRIYANTMRFHVGFRSSVSIYMRALGFTYQNEKNLERRHQQQLNVTVLMHNNIEHNNRMFLLAQIKRLFLFSCYLYVLVRPFSTPCIVLQRITREDQSVSPPRLLLFLFSNRIESFPFE